MLSPGKEALGHATYERHRPEQTLLYQLIEKHYPALIEQLAAHVLVRRPVDGSLDLQQACSGQRQAAQVGRGHSARVEGVAGKIAGADEENHFLSRRRGFEWEQRHEGDRDDEGQ